MGPQPFSSFGPRCEIAIGGALVFNHTSLAVPVASIIAYGAGISHAQGRILTSLLKADPITGMAMYQALTSAEAQRAALVSAAKTNLHPEDFELFTAISMATDHARRIRNQFAHHVYAFSPQIDRALLLLDPEALTEEGAAKRATIKGLKYAGVTIPPPNLDRKRVAVYRLKDLNHHVEICAQAYGYWNEFSYSMEYSLVDHIDKSTRRRLRSEPPIERALEALKKRTAGK